MFKKYYKEANDDIKTNRELIGKIFEAAEQPMKPKRTAKIYKFGMTAAAVLVLGVSVTMFSMFSNNSETVNQPSSIAKSEIASHNKKELEQRNTETTGVVKTDSAEIVEGKENTDVVKTMDSEKESGVKNFEAENAENSTLKSKANDKVLSKDNVGKKKDSNKKTAEQKKSTGNKETVEHKNESRDETPKIAVPQNIIPQKETPESEKIKNEIPKTETQSKEDAVNDALENRDKATTEPSENKNISEKNESSESDKQVPQPIAPIVPEDESELEPSGNEPVLAVETGESQQGFNIGGRTVEEPEKNEEKSVALDALKEVSADESKVLTDFLIERFGEKDEETGNLHSFGVAGKVDVDGETMYYVRWSWLVNNTHLSLVQNFVINESMTEIYNCVSSADEIYWSTANNVIE